VKQSCSGEERGVRIADDLLLIVLCLRELASHPELVREAICDWGFMPEDEIDVADLKYVCAHWEKLDDLEIVTVHVFTHSEGYPAYPIAGLICASDKAADKVTIVNDSVSKARAESSWGKKRALQKSMSQDPQVRH
jgi:hypothetical protein